jgi:hypothetical protein
MAGFGKNKWHNSMPRTTGDGNTCSVPMADNSSLTGEVFERWQKE